MAEGNPLYLPRGAKRHAQRRRSSPRPPGQRDAHRDRDPGVRRRIARIRGGRGHWYRASPQTRPPRAWVARLRVSASRHRRRSSGDDRVPRAAARGGGSSDRSVLSARRVGVGDCQVGVLPVLADFNLVTTLFPAQPSSSSRCPSTALVQTGLASVSLELLRGWRDDRLRAGRLGHIAFADYRRHGPEVCSLLAQHAVAADIAARALEDGQHVLRGRPASAARALWGAVRLATTLRPYAGPGLAHALRPSRVLTLGAALAMHGILDGCRR
jgi:hypothetical protein